jgi:hypothetical protein
MGGRKTFVTNTVLTAADVQDFLMDQSVMVFANDAARGSAIPSPTEGMVAYLTGSDSLEAYNGTAWTSAAGVSSGNAIINGGFDVWQRGTSVSLTTAGLAFSADRFYGFNNGNGSITASRQTFTPGAAPVAGYEGQFFHRLSIASLGTSTGWIFQQRIEDVRTFAGQTVTFSFWAKSSNTQTLSAGWEQNFGSGGSTAVTGALVSSITLTSSWTRYTYTATLPSISGKTVGTNPYLIFGFGIGSAIKTGDLDIWGVQLEAGSSANPFRRNANSIQGELAACQRYYYRATATTIVTNYGIGSNSSTTNAVIQIKTPVTMRISPHSVGFTQVMLTDGVTNYGVTAVALADAHPDLTMLNVTGIGLIQFRPSIFRANATTSSFVELSAELI